MRVTEKGQVTIPKPIREKLGIVPGSEVEFVEKDNVVQLVRTKAEDERPQDPEEFREWFDRHVERMRGTIDTMGMDGKEYVDWLRGPRDDIDPS